MFQNSDPVTTLELHRQKVDQMIREAADRERVRGAVAGRHRRFGRWRRHPERGGSRVTATA
jgi:hypothetical protein